MTGRIVRHELRVLRADRSASVAVALFVLAAAAATALGLRSVAARERAGEAVLAESEARYGELRAEAARAPDPASPSPPRGQQPSRVGMSIGRPAVLPPPALGFLSVGQADVLPQHYAVTGRSLETLAAADATEGPVALFAGSFDPAFVVLFLYPLLIIALAFDLTSSEREGGTLALVLAQPVSLTTLVGAKVLGRAIVLVLPALALPLLGVALSGRPLDPDVLGRALLAALAILAYGLFWFGLAVLVGARGRSSATNALLLAGAWLVLVVLVPGAVNLAASTRYPVPSRVESVTTLREATNEARLAGTRLLARFLEEHPELARPADQEDFAVLQVARDAEIARRLEPVRRRHREQLERQQGQVAAFSAASPTLLVQGALDEMAGAGLSRQRRFEAGVEGFHREWQAFFRERILAGRALSAADYDAMPVFRFEEEPFSAAARRALLPALAVAVAGLALLVIGFRAYARLTPATSA